MTLCSMNHNVVMLWKVRYAIIGNGMPFLQIKKDFVFLCYDFFFCLIEKYYLCIH